MSDLETIFRGALEAIEAQRTHPHGAPATGDDAKVAGNALIALCGGDRDKARTLWKVIASDLGYMPHAACVALVRAANTDNLVADVQAPEPR